MIAGKESFSLIKDTQVEERFSSLEQATVREITTPTSHCAVNRDVTVRSLIQRSRDAYITDGIFKQGVDKYFEFFRDIEFKGGDKQVQYLKTRLTQMSLESGQHWKSTIQAAILDLLKVGTTVLIKQRGFNDKSIVKRCLYQNRTSGLSQLIPADILSFEPVIKDGVMQGWKINQDFKLSLKKTGNLSGGFIKVNTPPEVLIPNADLLILTYRKGPDSVYGIGMGFSALEDINILRSLEQVIAIMIKKFAIPTMLHTVARPAGFVGSLQQEINNAHNLWARNGPDSIIIAPDNHDVKVIGSESSALRAEGYIKLTTARACASMGLNPYALGFESGTIGSDKATREMMLNRVRSIQVELSNVLQMFLLNELLWEGGFDPYTVEEDVVRLEFTEIDMDTVIKSQNHAADLWQKEALTHGELRKHLDKNPEAPITDFRTHKLGEVEHKFNKELKSQQDAAKAKKAAGRPKKEFVNDNPDALDSYLNELIEYFELPTNVAEEIKPLLQELINDPLALQELIEQKTNEI